MFLDSHNKLEGCGLDRGRPVPAGSSTLEGREGGVRHGCTVTISVNARPSAVREEGRGTMSANMELTEESPSLPRPMMAAFHIGHAGTVLDFASLGCGFPKM